VDGLNTRDLKLRYKDKSTGPFKPISQSISFKPHFVKFRYTTTFDKVLLIIGSVVAVGTGIGLPMMSIIMGNVSQNFMDINGNTT
ncbi:hypothetical protein COOONC_13551, partial [Cooperia oncophora]